MSPKVSVIIPNYNHAQYLEQRIESVLNQTYQDFEVIILDDCSPDDGASRAVIERYRENPHVTHIVYNEVNSGGVFKQWKKGTELSKGELVWIAESDDKNAPEFLEVLVKCFDENNNLALAFTKSWLFDDAGKQWTMDAEGLEEGVYDSREFISRFMSRGCVMLNASSCLFSRSAFDKIDDRYTSFRASGDYMFWTLISEQGNIAVVDARLNYYRKHLTNVTGGGYFQGINQCETKDVLNYILEGKYISQKEYNAVRKDLMRSAVFELLTDKEIKKRVYDYWQFSKLQQFGLKLTAWKNKIAKIFG